MPEKKSILVVEDDLDASAAIEASLLDSTRFDFAVAVAPGPSEYLKQGLHEKRFDLVVVDLELVKGRFPVCGLRVILDRTIRFPGDPIIVFSEYDSDSNIIKSIQFGASDFICKRKCDPADLGARIEQIFLDQVEDLKRKEEVDELMARNYAKWEEKYPGEFIVLVGKRVVAHGANRLEALVRYNDKMDTHPDWPDFPDVIEIPGEESA